jgi:hypothetical protein
MESFLKTATVRIESLDRDLDIRELCAKAQIEILESHRADRSMDTYFIACKYGVPEWESETLEDISMKFSLHVLKEISDAVAKLAGLDEAKNSDSAPSDDSSTD